ncbi:hypothetical protein SCHIN_v1c07590 [Spiroplasma chinense]|uniref:Uncharacterized protein n=1 Tax=Spiroplasma chinense TaxID=216932 RepID=A0A5B9Y4E7_9MOLU|nr:hypothetical protein [Spiroplasma chinense]QEH61954.1 hypothetical protein SCHIN_v1c07590 [Spiroplasma chinense]
MNNQFIFKITVDYKKLQAELLNGDEINVPDVILNLEDFDKQFNLIKKESAQNLIDFLKEHFEERGLELAGLIFDYYSRVLEALKGYPFNKRKRDLSDPIDKRVTINWNEKNSVSESIEEIETDKEGSFDLFDNQERAQKVEELKLKVNSNFPNSSKNKSDFLTFFNSSFEDDKASKTKSKKYNKK